MSRRDTMPKVTLKEFVRQMRAQSIRQISVESCSDTPGGIHTPSRVEEYSIEDDSIKNLSSEMMEEIYEGMRFRRSQVSLVRQVGGTLEVKVG
ncbi:TPA: hypothetical protein DHW62_00330 [candidate division WWE3 bacterium]|uniref:Uncharacterized protein n=1 Tax=candidate division WWE3 bacterium TaxID=2053526 RepID=A0A656PL52_UNCKA|nr:MAG: hypothetical protein A2364_01580 [candidate division WWE3 bacterium RIFOXYB1_FULL_43_12]HAI95417.1 hypothetical protein [candidate division WWE3 bacterium]HBL00872.1 hypothetical protein [candidate division WWE3 bacterium]HBT66560.1 hypothetical protein [candidate division WWE3 bacterium]HCE36501.1 hypothetical protein [candidate division WWE3 bacterium]